jgi:hypothetical protein
MNTMSELSTETLARAATWCGTTSAVTLWGLQVSDLAVIVSAGVAVLGFFVHVIMTMRRERREIVTHLATIASLQRGATPNVRRDAGGRNKGSRGS